MNPQTPKSYTVFLSETGKYIHIHLGMQKFRFYIRNLTAKPILLDPQTIRVFSARESDDVLIKTDIEFDTSEAAYDAWIIIPTLIPHHLLVNLK